MAQSLTDYLKAIEYGLPPPTVVILCGCGCGKPLEKHSPLGPRWIGTGENRKQINEDCFFEAFSAEIDKHPIGGLGIHGPKNRSPID